MQEPEKPHPNECCGTGCVGCVYDVYVEELQRYEAWKKQQEKKRVKEDETLP